VAERDERVAGRDRREHDGDLAAGGVHSDPGPGLLAPAVVLQEDAGPQRLQQDRERDDPFTALKARLALRERSSTRAGRVRVMRCLLAAWTVGPLCRAGPPADLRAA
jgi:hypothetical protein